MKYNSSAEEAAHYNTIVVPAHSKGFQDVFCGALMWPNLKVDKNKIANLKYIAIYQTSPISAITHYGEVKEYVALERVGRFNIFIKSQPIEIEHVKLTPQDVCAVQGPRYTTLELILSAKQLSRAFP